jgi:hypothetical protein
MTTPRDLPMVAIDMDFDRPLEQGDLSLALVGGRAARCRTRTLPRTHREINCPPTGKSRCSLDTRMADRQVACTSRAVCPHRSHPSAIGRRSLYPDLSAVHMPNSMLFRFPTGVRSTAAASVCTSHPRRARRPSEVPRIFRTADSAVNAASCSFRYWVRTSCGV